MAPLDAFTASLARPESQPETSFLALARLADAMIGAKLFTLTTFDQATREARRIHSNLPDAYPVLGTKPIDESPWTVRVLDGQETFVANDIAAIAEVFSDHRLIRSIGCESVVNVPVTAAGRVLGTINCLHETGHYTPERVAASAALKLPGAACFLLHASLSRQGGE